MFAENPTALIQAVAELARPDEWHLEQARHRKRTGVPFRTTATGALGGALAGLAAAWAAEAQRQADAAWAGLLLPAERLGQVDAARVVARATPEHFAALCIGPKWPPRVAYRDWFRRHGRTAPGGWTRSWSGRRCS